MNELTNFDFEGAQIRALTIDEAPYFVGKDVATVLGYAKPTDATRKHVDPEDRGISKMETPSGIQEMTVINKTTKVTGKGQQYFINRLVGDTHATQN